MNVNVLIVLALKTSVPTAEHRPRCFLCNISSLVSLPRESSLFPASVL